MMDIEYISLEEVIIIHDEMIKIGGGRRGVRDLGLLLSALERPKATFNGRYLYPTIWLQTAALMHSIVKNHPFVDGNKRTGFFTALRFLNKNGYMMSLHSKEIVTFTLKVAHNKLAPDDIAKWFKKRHQR